LSIFWLALLSDSPVCCCSLCFCASQEYNTAYGVYWYKVHAPESNAILVVLLLLGVLSAAHFAVLTQRKNEYNAKLVKLVQTNAGPAQGGTLEVTNKAGLLPLPTRAQQQVKRVRSLC